MIQYFLNPKTAVSKNLAFVSTFYLFFFLIFVSYAAIHTFPEEDRRAPFLKAIRSAKTKIRMAAYKFTDQQIMDALKSAADQGVHVTLLKEGSIWLRPDMPAAQQGGDDPSAYLKHKNIHISGTPTRFDQTHSKAIIVDDRSAVVTTSNFCDMDDQFYRDFAIEVSNPAALRDLIHIFDADIKDHRAVAPTPGHVVWGPDHQRSTFLRMINGAQKRIWVYQQDLQDANMGRTLAAAAKNGVQVRILMMEFPFGPTNKSLPNQILLVKSGAQVMFVDPKYRYIHAKIMIADDEMYMGSCNFYSPSIDGTRELGILTKDRDQIRKISSIFEEDWKHAKALVPDTEA